jgi:hypothetical protein
MLVQDIINGTLTFFELIRLMSSAPLLAGILVISTLNTRLKSK